MYPPDICTGGMYGIYACVCVCVCVCVFKKKVWKNTKQIDQVSMYFLDGN
jgi:hypothetical protein